MSLGGGFEIFLKVPMIWQFDYVLMQTLQKYFLEMIISKKLRLEK